MKRKNVLFAVGDKFSTVEIKSSLKTCNIEVLRKDCKLDKHSVRYYNAVVRTLNGLTWKQKKHLFSL